MKKITFVYIVYVSIILMLVFYFSTKILSKNYIAFKMAGVENRFLEIYTSIPDKVKNNEYVKSMEGFKDYNHNIIKPNNTFRIFPDMHLNEKGYDILSTKVIEFLLKISKIKTR